MKNVTTHIKPEWVRAPSRGQEYFSGIARSKLYRLVDGHIVSKSLVDPGKKRGLRLFHLQSILNYIASAPLDPPPPEKAKSPAKPGVEAKPAPISSAGL